MQFVAEQQRFFVAEQQHFFVAERRELPGALPENSRKNRTACAAAVTFGPAINLASL